MALNKIHITHLRNFIDELIITKGVLKIENPEKVIEKVRVDYLIKLAFRFYSKLYSSEKYANHIKICENNIELDDGKRCQPIIQNILSLMSSEDADQDIQCLNCGIAIPIKELEKSGDSLPVCSTCEDEIGLELDIWERVFD